MVLNGESVKDAKELAATWLKHVVEHQFAVREAFFLLSLRGKRLFLRLDLLSLSL